MKTVALLFLASLSAASFGTDPSPDAAPSENRNAIPPTQPLSGPGGAQYPHAGFRETMHGTGGTQFWILEPARPTPETAPLVIFLHGFSAMTPDTYRGWVNHLAKRGNIVVYPRYQERLLTPAAEYFPNVAVAVRDALAVLAKSRSVKPDLQRVALVGHSAGGVQVANYAALAGSGKLPAAKAAMIVEPGQGSSGGVKIIPMEDCKKFSAELRLIVVVGDADGFVGTGCARAIWRDTGHVRERAFITVRSDAHGTPALRADHLSPISWTRQATDAVDWFGYWKTFDALLESTFSGKPLSVDPGMGAWSDGTPVVPMKVERSAGVPAGH